MAITADPSRGTPLPARPSPRTRGGLGLRQGLFGPAALLGASVAFQAAGAVAVPVFAVAGPLGASGLRFAVATALVWLVVRPRLLRGWTGAAWAWAVGLGVVMAAMSACSYAVLARLPLGTASTLEFLGPLAVAVAAARTGRHLAAAALALAGVALICGPRLAVPLNGVLLGLLTAAVLAGYVQLQHRARRHSSGAEALAVAAAVKLPLAIPAIPHLTGNAALRITVAGVLGVGVAYGLDGFGIGRVGPRAAGVLLSLDPAVGALSGLLLLGQALPASAIVGVAAVVTAGLLSGIPAAPPAVPRTAPPKEHTGRTPMTDHTNAGR